MADKWRDKPTRIIPPAGSSHAERVAWYDGFENGCSFAERMRAYETAELAVKKFVGFVGFVRMCVVCDARPARTLPDPIPEGYPMMWSEQAAGYGLYCQPCFDEPQECDCCHE